MDSFGFSRARRKNNDVIFLVSAPDTKGLNGVCVCVGMGEKSDSLSMM